jgi:hypothetical protein
LILKIVIFLVSTIISSFLKFISSSLSFLLVSWSLSSPSSLLFLLIFRNLYIY